MKKINTKYFHTQTPRSFKKSLSFQNVHKTNLLKTPPIRSCRQVAGKIFHIRQNRNCSFQQKRKCHYVPTNKTNTIINFCHQNNKIIRERFGKYCDTVEPGIFLSIPFIDRLTEVDMRELTMPINPQSAITKDNVSVSLAGNVYVRFVDPYRAVYGSNDPIYAVTQHSQSSMRAKVGQLTLDELFHNRDILNTYILGSLSKAIEPWGIEVNRYEVTSVNTEQKIHDAMNRQAEAERKRREDVLHAEALKRSAELTSEGERQKMINESEGWKMDQINRAQGEAESIKLRADAKYYELVKQAEGKAQSLEIINASLVNKDSKAMNYDLSLRYFKEFGKIVGKSNTIMVPHSIDNISDIVTRALVLMDGIKQTNTAFNDKHA